MLQFFNLKFTFRILIPSLVMKKTGLLLLMVLLWSLSIHGQTFTSVTDWPMPAGQTRGLVRPAFKCVPRFVKVALGEEVHVKLIIDVTFSTPMNPVAPYAFRYLYNGNIYTDEDLGQDVFKAIKLARAVFSVRVQGANNYNKQISYNSVIGAFDLGIFPKNVNVNEFAAHIQALEEVSYYGTQTIEQTINNLKSKQVTTQTNTNTKPNAIGNKPTAPTHTNNTNSVPNVGTTTPTNGAKAQVKDPVNQLIKPTAPTKDTFWSDKTSQTTTESTEVGKVIPEQPNHKNLPNFVQTTDGGYYYRGSDGRFRQVTAAEYDRMKKASIPVTQGNTPSHRSANTEETRIAIDKMFSDAKARNDAVNQKIEQVTYAWAQNFYFAEAIRNGKQNLAALSSLGGNYNSVTELENEFNQKYYSIRSEVSNLESARNAKLANAVAGNFNGSTTEQAVGQGVQLIGGILNSAKADKERKEAEAALKAERARQIAAIAAAKQKARLELRTKLLRSFPDGGTPLTAHKVTAKEIYMFGYITDKSTFQNETGSVAISNVFPVAQYSDGTFPFKTTVANKLKGYAPGDVVLIGYYADKDSAEQMRNSFINLAAKSELTVKQFVIKTLPSGNATPGANNDFWETGKKAGTTVPKPDKKADFWNN